MPFLKTCVESVRAQRMTDWEMLVSDDGSTDGSRQWLATLDDDRIRFFTQDRNLGIFGNLNFLFAKATAPISQILCQDDHFVDAGSLESILRRWREIPDHVGFIRENWTDANAKHEIGRWGVRNLPEMIGTEVSDLIFFVFGCIAGNLSNISVRTELVAHTGWFDQHYPYAGDFQFWSRLGRSYSFLLEGSELTYVRSHPGQASFHLNRRAELVAQQYAIVEDLYQRLRSRRSEFMLRLHATVQYDALQRWVAVRRLFRAGDPAYLRTVDAQGSMHAAFLSKPLRWLVFFLSGGGRWGSSLTAERLLREW